MWFTPTYLRLLKDVFDERLISQPFIADEKDGTSTSSSSSKSSSSPHRAANLSTTAVINNQKLKKLINYINLSPKKAANVCVALYKDIKTNVAKHKMRNKIKANLIIFQEMSAQCQKHGLSSVIEFYFSRCIELLLNVAAVSTPSRHFYLTLAASSFNCYAQYCCSNHQDKVPALIHVVLQHTALACRNSCSNKPAALDLKLAYKEMISDSDIQLEEAIKTINLSMFQRVVEVLSCGGQLTGCGTVVSSIVRVLYSSYNTLETCGQTTATAKSRQQLLIVKQCIATVCANPSPFVLLHVSSAFLREFHGSGWLATSAGQAGDEDNVIEYVLKTLIRVSSDMRLQGYHIQIPSVLLVCACDSVISSHSSSSSSSLSDSSPSTSLTPTLNRAPRRLCVGSEDSIRHFPETVNTLERVLEVTLRALKFQNSISSCDHSVSQIFENDFDNLVDIVLHCVAHSHHDEWAKRLKDRSYQSDSPSHCTNSIFVTADKTDIVSRIFELVSECMKETACRRGRSGGACGVSAAARVLLRALEHNDASGGGSSLSQTVRLLLLHYLQVVVTESVELLSSSLSSQQEDTPSLRSKCSLTSVMEEISPRELCQVCVYARSHAAGVQSVAGDILLRLIESVERKSKDYKKVVLFPSSLLAHSEALHVQLVRNTIFNILVRSGQTPGQHTSSVILAWELQKKMIQRYSHVEMFAAMPMIFALEVFWKNYFLDDVEFDAEESRDDFQIENIEIDENINNDYDRKSLLKFELLNNLVIFVCVFFRFLDDELNLDKQLVGQIELLAHIDRFGTSLLYENESLFVKQSPQKETSARLNEFRLPRVLNAAEIINSVLTSGVISDRLLKREKNLVQSQLLDMIYTPVESPYEILLRQRQGRIERHQHKRYIGGATEGRGNDTNKDMGTPLSLGKRDDIKNNSSSTNAKINYNSSTYVYSDEEVPSLKSMLFDISAVMTTSVP